MPTLTTYPGVYIEEVASGVRTITGVATSITAFVGRAWRGPTDVATTINSFGDFERIFGGLWIESALGFAVRDFFLNGGAQAIIVRCFSPAAGSFATLSVDGLVLQAAWPGSWGNRLRVRVDLATRPLLPGEAADSVFNLTVKDVGTGRIEIFRNVSITAGHARRVEKVLENESLLLRATTVPSQRPGGHSPIAAGADPDPFSDAFPARYTAVASAGEANDGGALTAAAISDPALEGPKKGMYALLDADLFNLLCIPPHKLSSAPDATGRDLESTLIDTAAAFCAEHHAFLIVDPPHGGTLSKMPLFQGSLTPTNHAALYFPTLLQPNPLHDGQIEEFAPCGAVAGIMARTDSERGVWKAPAGTDARLIGVPALSVPLTDAEIGMLNPLGINCLRAIPAAGRVVWGARTLEGSDRLASEWKYIPVRRTALFIEESLERGTQWVVFEPNDEPLWAQIRLNLGAFMQTLFRQGAFAGKTPREAYLVKCDRETTTQDDINRGVVNVLVGFAPLKPAEFVIIKIQQLAGQIET
ncbi:MAG: phage tail sheath family protein [Verrucomicrobiia bacterium]